MKKVNTKLKECEKCKSVGRYYDVICGKCKAKEVQRMLNRSVFKHGTYNQKDKF